MFLSVKKKKTTVMNIGLSQPTHLNKQLSAAWLLAFHMWNLRRRVSWWEKWHRQCSCENTGGVLQRLCMMPAPAPPGEPPTARSESTQTKMRASWPEPLQGAYCKPDPFVPRMDGACRFKQAQEEKVLDYRNKESRPEDLTSDQCPWLLETSLL